MLSDFEFDDQNNAANMNWQAVNDGVMGGRSSGGPQFKNGKMVFAGNINTNGGGFSSVRAAVDSGTFNAAKGVNLRIKSDGRAYKLTFRTNARYGWRRVSFQAVLPSTPIGEWREISVPFSNLRASLFGRPVNGAKFEKQNIVEMGLILADGIDGPFEIEVDWLKACPN